MSKAPPARVITPKSPIPAATSPAAQVKVFTFFELSRGRPDGAEGDVFPLSGTGPPFVGTAKNTLTVGRVKSACTLLNPRLSRQAYRELPIPTLFVPLWRTSISALGYKRESRSAQYRGNV
jgi:hypothetical protein